MPLPFLIPFWIKALLVASAVTSGVQTFSAFKQAKEIRKRGKKVEALETERLAEEERLKKQSAARILKRRGIRAGAQRPTRADIRTSAIGIPGQQAGGGKTLIGT